MNSAPQATREEIVEVLEQAASYGVTSPGVAAALDIGSANFLNYFRNDLLKDFISKGGSACRVFEGAYGAGKSHILQLLGQAAARENMLVARIDLSQALKLEEWSQITAHVLQEITFAGEPFTKSLPRLIRSRMHEVTPAKLLEGRLPHPGFGRAAACALLQTISSAGLAAVNRYLCGEKVTIAELKSHGVVGVKEPLNARNAEQILQTACMLHRRLGFRGTVLLFDENEKVFSKWSTKVTKSANLLRRLIDSSASGRLESTLFVFAVLPDFLSSCANAYPALGQRLQAPELDLDSAWRWPVLDLDSTNSASEPEDFLNEMVEKLVQLSSGVKPSGDLAATLREAGEDVLNEHAGSGFRRPLLKRLATMVLDHIEE